ncbi:hypothetical protein HMPREF0004_4828 [Achromobacter piechaudii ATCC 43553]|uniref:Uncharacterized protein n=1 Tax=Achromobacter piechaudii ATCC 43553 TaxID=742159 RepID=D4XH81_9BURK|nr:hypothetical protein HMPREF0004_4828 [Achromobacter piechaudii ATCC 43553]
MAAGWVDFLADHCRVACCAVLSSRFKVSELRRSETIAQVLRLS